MIHTDWKTEIQSFRLKVLKDEIKKPYFIALKKFLWEEGVRGPDEIPKSLKVYPSREPASLNCVLPVLTFKHH
jgi:hypothetical protein